MTLVIKIGGDLYVTSSWLVRDLYVTCSWLVRDLLVIQSLITSCSWKERDFLQEVKILNTNSCPFVRISKGKFLNSAALLLQFSFSGIRATYESMRLMFVYFMNSVLIWLKHLIKIKIEQLKFGIYLYENWWLTLKRLRNPTIVWWSSDMLIVISLYK